MSRRIVHYAGIRRGGWSAYGLKGPIPIPHLTRNSPDVAVPAQNALHSGHLGVGRPRKPRARVKCFGKVLGDAL